MYVFTCLPLGQDPTTAQNGEHIGLQVESCHQFTSAEAASRAEGCTEATLRQLDDLQKLQVLVSPSMARHSTRVTTVGADAQQQLSHQELLAGPQVAHKSQAGVKCQLDAAPDRFAQDQTAMPAKGHRHRFQCQQMNGVPAAVAPGNLICQSTRLIAATGLPAAELGRAVRVVEQRCSVAYGQPWPPHGLLSKQQQWVQRYVDGSGSKGSGQQVCALRSCRSVHLPMNARAA
jgi:hypothetical protein